MSIDWIKPATKAVAVDVSSTDHDLSSVVANHSCGRAIYIGGAGDLAVTTSGGSTITFKNLPAGITQLVQVTKVLKTGTTATDIVALF